MGVNVGVAVGGSVGFGDGGEIEARVGVKVGLGEVFLPADAVDSFKAVLLLVFGSISNLISVPFIFHLVAVSNSVSGLYLSS